MHHLQADDADEDQRQMCRRDSVDTVRNYFGGKHESKECVGVHFEPGPDGGVVTLDDTTILDVAMRILSEQ